MAKEYAIGERFEYEGVMLEVVEGGSCGDCFFNELLSCGNAPSCSIASGRSDKKSVHYVSAGKPTRYDAYTRLIEQAETIIAEYDNSAEMREIAARLRARRDTMPETTARLPVDAELEARR